MSDFNPSEHNIDDVNAHLEEHPEELQAVLDAEKAGKNRPTLVSSLEERVAQTPVAAEPKPVTVAPSPTPTTVGLLDQFERTPERGFRKKS